MRSRCFICFTYVDTSLSVQYNTALRGISAQCIILSSLLLSSTKTGTQAHAVKTGQRQLKTWRHGFLNSQQKEVKTYRIIPRLLIYDITEERGHLWAKVHGCPYFSNRVIPWRFHHLLPSAHGRLQFHVNLEDPVITPVSKSWDEGYFRLFKSLI